MKIFLYVCFLIFLLLFAPPVSASFYNFDLGKNKQSISYRLCKTPDASFSSDLFYNISIGAERLIELSAGGEDSWYVSSLTTVKLSAKLKQRVWQWNKLSLTGIIGAVNLYVPGRGVALGFDLGGICGYKVYKTLNLSASLICSVFQDGFLFDGAAGTAYKFSLKGNELNIPFGIRYTSFQKSLSLFFGMGKEW